MNGGFLPKPAPRSGVSADRRQLPALRTPVRGMAALRRIAATMLVAPMVTKGTARTVQIPSGKWKADDGTLITGPVQKAFEVPLGRLLYFERQ